MTKISKYLVTSVSLCVLTMQSSTVLAETGAPEWDLDEEEITAIANAYADVSAEELGKIEPAAGEGQAKDLKEALTEGTPDISFRYRFAHIDDDAAGKTENAKASTIQTLVGYKTKKFHDTSAYVQFRNVSVIGNDLYNDTLNGKTSYPTEADPEATEVDQAFLQFDGIQDTSVTVGRRKLIWGNQRFVSALGWRQNNRSFDGAVIENSSLPDTEIKYAYANNVNRAFTDDSPSGNFDESTIHMVNVANTSTPLGTITGYVYLLDLDGFSGATGLASSTYGVNLTGAKEVSDGVKFLYVAEYAHQSDYGDNPTSYDASYHRVEPGVSFGGLTLKAGYEVLGSDDGMAGFTAPLGLLHAYNGWADKFLATPATGLEDLYGSAVYKVSGTGTPLDGAKIILAYHDFSADEGGADYGAEWDAAIGKKFLGNYSILLKYASYDGDSAAPTAQSTDVQKAWVVLGAKF